MDPSSGGNDKVPDATIELAEETFSVSKRQIDSARVRVRVRTETDTVNPRVSLFDQHVEVQRVPIGREVTEIPQIREEGDVTIIPILEEILVVEKRLILKEEVHVRRAVSQTEVTQPVTLRRQRAEVERTAIEPEDTNQAKE
jgi:stress response protein YsnF